MNDAASGWSRNEIEEFLHLADRAARAAGQEARSWEDRPFKVRLKADHSEVSEADEAAQHAAITLIRASRPDDAIIAEEALAPGGALLPPPTDERPCWIIDPIDGTRNFVRGLGDYTSSVGVWLGGQPLAGAVYHPRLDTAYTAARGGRPLIDGIPVRHHSTRGSSLIVGIPSTARGLVRDLAHAWFDEHVVRNFGSAALHLAFVATGQLDAAVMTNTKLWDIAGGAALVLAAGGEMCAPAGDSLFPLRVAGYCGEEIPALVLRAGVRARLLGDRDCESSR